MPSVAAYVPTRGHVWYETAARMGQLPFLAADLGYALTVEYIRSQLGVVQARNEILHRFLESDAEILMMCDDDVVPPPDALETADDVVSGGDIVAVPCPVLRPNMPILPNVYSWDYTKKELSFDLLGAQEDGYVKFDAVGFGCVFLSKRVCRKLGSFKFRYENGVVSMGEDVDFCLRARSQGMTVAARMGSSCEHLVLVHGNSVALTYDGLYQGLEGAT